MSLLPEIIAGGLSVLYVIIFAATTLWLARLGRKGRTPFAQNEKMLRRPGQHLEEEVERLDDKLIDKMLIGMIGPPLICCGLLLGLPWVPREHLWWTFLLIVVLGLFVFVMRVRDAHGLIKKRRDLRLGLWGERYVAEKLQPLTEMGYAVFHDVPADGRKGPFNLDHIVVGPSGVFVIETKTRRKDRQNQAGEDHRITFDGQAIHWPGGAVDRAPLEQARASAHWLREWLKNRLVVGHLSVKAFVTFPGWFVDAKGRSDVNVWNPKQLIAAIEGNPVLDSQMVKQIRAQFDSLCRTVAIEV